MTNYRRSKYVGRLYTKEEMQEIRAENCKTHGQRRQDMEDRASAVSIIGKIMFGIIVLAYLLIPVIERAILG